MEKKATCAYPKPEKSPKFSPSLKAQGYHWLSDLDESGFEV